MNAIEIKKIKDAELEGKKVLLRVDFNVSIENGKIRESFKIRAIQNTLNYLLEKKCKVALVSHLGRPKLNEDNSKFSLNILKDDVEKILRVKVKFISDCLSKEIVRKLKQLSKSEILLLENVRFYKEEENNDENFSKKLAEPFEIYVNDAFSVCHRQQASVTGITNFLPSFGGFRLQEEISEMEKIENDFFRPATAIIGGAKIETKLPVIKFFEKKYSYVLVGGKIANEALDQQIKFSEKVILPFDFIDDRLDIGPKTLEKFKDIIGISKTIVWNGPTGKFEDSKYAVSSNEILKSILASEAYAVIGGGETLEVLEKNEAINEIDFVSTGGGAMLEYLSGNEMPGINALKNS